MGKSELAWEVSAYRCLIGARLRGQLQYRVSFWLQCGGLFVVYLLEFAVVLILFRHFATLGGWRVGEIAFLYGLSALAFGIAHTLAAGFATFSEQIRRGEFDRILVRPMGAMAQVLASDIQLHRLSGAVQGAIVLGVAMRLVEIDWSVGKVIYLPIVVLSAILLFMALFALEATLCFWTIEATEVVNAFTYGGAQMALYPLHIYDAWLRRLFLFVVPLGLVIYTPSLFVLNKPDPLGLPAWMRFVAPVAAVGFALLASIAWRVGVRHYRSTGS